MRTFFTKLQLVLALSFFANEASLAQSDDPSQSLDAHRQNVLAQRIDLFVEAGLQAVLSCSAYEPEAQKSSLLIQTLRAGFQHSQSPSVDNILQLMLAYREVERFKAHVRPQSRCAVILSRAFLAIYSEEREPFRLAYQVSAAAKLPWKSKSPLQALLFELDPTCDRHILPDFKSEHADGYPCSAGFNLVLKGMRDLEASGVIADQAIQEIKRIAKKLRPGKAFDLMKISAFPQKTLDERINTLAILTFLYTAPGSRSGASSAYGDTFWREPLSKGIDPILAYNSYMLWMNRKDLYTSYLNRTRKKGVKVALKIGKHYRDVSSWNNHNFISAFLACHFQSQGKAALAKLVPNALGIAYEAKDFVSHLREGVSFKQSRQNFTRDTRRHREGAQFGHEYCSQ